MAGYANFCDAVPQSIMHKLPLYKVLGHFIPESYSGLMPDMTFVDRAGEQVAYGRVRAEN